MEITFFHLFVIYFCANFTSQDGVPLVQYDTFGYYADVDVGNPPQRFRMVIDTGSSDTWIPSLKVNTDFCSSMRKFNCSASRTCLSNKTNINFNKKIGSTTISGSYLRDDFNIGGVDVTELRFASVNNVPVKMCLLSQYDGYLGMAHPSRFFSNQERIQTKKKYDENCNKSLTISFRLRKDQAKKIDGEISVGYATGKEFNGSKRLVNASSIDRWSVRLNKIRISGMNFKIQPSMATVSTGSPMISVPSAYIVSMVERLVNYPMWDRKNSTSDVFFVECDKAASFRDVSFNFGDVWLTLTPKDYVIPTSYVNYFPDGTCYIGLEETKNSTWTFGIILLKKYLTEFRFGSPSVIRFGDLN